MSEYQSAISKIHEDYGRMPPHAVELEEAVLGALMLEKDAIVEVLDILKPDSFYKEAHKKIYTAIVELSTEHEGIDMLTVTERLRKLNTLSEVGGPFYITQLTSRVVSASNINFHGRIIAQKYIQRELIRVSSEIQKRAFDQTIDVNDLLDFAESELFNVAYGNINKEVSEMKPLITNALRMIEEAAKREDGLSGVPSGFTSLDRVTNGWQNSDLVIIAARPSMGKTSFVLSMARNMTVDHKRPIALFSLEMSSLQLVNRLIVSESGISSEKIRSGRLTAQEWEQLTYKIGALEDAQIFIDDTPAISVFELRAKCRRLKMKHNIQLIIIDYLQLMSAGGDSKGSREQEVSTISRSLKAIAKELDVPVLALSQLNRSVEMRSGDKRPQLSDLRESGAIEQDADLVCFIHRPEKYGITEDESGNSTKGLAEIIIAKHRNGAVTDVQLKFITELAKFTDLDDHGISALADNDFADSEPITLQSKMNTAPPKDFDLHNEGEDAPF